MLRARNPLAWVVHALANFPARDVLHYFSLLLQLCSLLAAIAASSNARNYVLPDIFLCLKKRRNSKAGLKSLLVHLTSDYCKAKRHYFSLRMPYIIRQRPKPIVAAPISHIVAPETRTGRFLLGLQRSPQRSTIYFTIGYPPLGGRSCTKTLGRGADIFSMRYNGWEKENVMITNRSNHCTVRFYYSHINSNDSYSWTLRTTNFLCVNFMGGVVQDGAYLRDGSICCLSVGLSTGFGR